MTSRSSLAQKSVGWQRSLTHLLGGLICTTVLLQPLAGFAQRPSGNRPRLNTITVSFTPGRPANRFLPSHALGAGIDGHDKGEADRQLKPANVEAMLSAGLKSLTYRLRTELAVDAWHWNPQGVWSDTGNKQGYWISDGKVNAPIWASYGYRLPRRGNTIDQGNNDGYSRLDDGDRENFWKSNPYLDRHFTHEDNSLHPQWIVIEFSEQKSINAAHLFWGTPFASNYRVQYARFDDTSDIALNPTGMWHDFPGGHPGSKSAQEFNGEVFLRLAAAPIKTRFVRILMTKSSDTAVPGSTDVRDQLGFA